MASSCCWAAAVELVSAVSWDQAGCLQHQSAPGCCSQYKLSRLCGENSHFVFEFGSTAAYLTLVELQASAWQPGMQRELFVLNFFCETEKSAQSYWGKW